MHVGRAQWPGEMEDVIEFIAAFAIAFCILNPAYLGRLIKNTHPQLL